MHFKLKKYSSRWHTAHSCVVLQRYGSCCKIVIIGEKMGGIPRTGNYAQPAYYFIYTATLKQRHHHHHHHHRELLRAAHDPTSTCLPGKKWSRTTAHSLRS